MVGSASLSAKETGIGYMRLEREGIDSSYHIHLFIWDMTGDTLGWSCLCAPRLQHDFM